MIVLLQPRSPWGKHPYLPNGLLAVATRLEKARVPWQLLDENLGETVAGSMDIIGKASAIGIGCLGSPYVTEVLRTGKEVRDMGCTVPILIGGEFIKRLKEEQFDQIFRALTPVVMIGTEESLETFVGFNMPSIHDLSMGNVIRKLPKEKRIAYFRKEWCLFTSQGCKYQCNFCAADKGVPERFRAPEAMEDEAEALAAAVHEAVGTHPPYEVYCSTLDGFQNPDQMESALVAVKKACDIHGVQLRLRFLATAKETVRAEEKHPGVIKRFRELGVGCVGIGADGDDPATWKRENKRHNSHENIRTSFELLRENGIQSEAFMVIGLPGEDWNSIKRGGLACIRYARLGIRPRPYLGKAGVPGGQAWAVNERIASRLLENPRLFLELDYGGLGSPVTHPDKWQRRIANTVFMATCLVLKATDVGCPTQPLLPSESVSLSLRMLARVWNPLMPQDR